MKYELGANDSWQVKDVFNKDVKRFDNLSNPIVIEEFSCRVYTLKDISASQERLCHLLSKNYKSACAICWENIILHSHPEIEISFKFIPKILMSEECIHFLGYSVCK